MAMFNKSYLLKESLDQMMPTHPFSEMIPLTEFAKNFIKDQCSGSDLENFYHIPDDVELIVLPRILKWVGFEGDFSVMKNSFQRVAHSLCIKSYTKKIQRINRLCEVLSGRDYKRVVMACPTLKADEIRTHHLQLHNISLLYDKYQMRFQTALRELRIQATMHDSAAMSMMQSYSSTENTKSYNMFMVADKSINIDDEPNINDDDYDAIEKPKRAPKRVADDNLHNTSNPVITKKPSRPRKRNAKTIAAIKGEVKSTNTNNTSIIERKRILLPEGAPSSSFIEHAIKEGEDVSDAFKILPNPIMSSAFEAEINREMKKLVDMTMVTAAAAATETPIKAADMPVIVAAAATPIETAKTLNILAPIAKINTLPPNASQGKGLRSAETINSTEQYSSSSSSSEDDDNNDENNSDSETSSVISEYDDNKQKKVLSTPPPPPAASPPLRPPSPLPPAAVLQDEIITPTSNNNNNNNNLLKPIKIQRPIPRKRESTIFRKRLNFESTYSDDDDDDDNHSSSPEI